MTEEANAAQAETETPVENTELETQATEASAPQTTEDTSEKEHKTDGVQQRINKITADKYAEKRRADELQNKLDSMQANQHTVVTEAPVLPKEEDFDYDSGKYQAALAKYNSEMVDHRVDAKLKAQRDQEADNQKSQRRNEVQSKFNQQIAESNIDGYVEAIQTLPNFDQSVLDAVMQSENGVKVAYYLSQHLDQADAIASVDPVSAAMKIGEISAQLKAVQKQTKPSAAPDPVDPINQGGSSIGSGDDPLIAGASFE